MTQSIATQAAKRRHRPMTWIVLPRTVTNGTTYLSGRTRRFLGIPTSAEGPRTREHASKADVEAMIRAFFEGRHDWLRHTLGAAATGGVR